MQFLYQPLTWGFLLVAVPLAIHLINLTRQRRVRWAAMEFLLEANKKHRRWIWLRQYALLATRMLLVAVAVAMLAHLVTRNQWSRLLGSSTTHHLILLDDTLSMSDQMGIATPFQQAESVVQRLAEHMASAEWGQKLTLIRLSQASRLPAETTDRDPLAAVHQVADFFSISVDDEFSKRLENLTTTLQPTSLAIWPTQALQLVTQLVETLDKQRPVVHLVSDFREETWGRPAELVAQIDALEKKGVEVRLVRCTEQSHDNLAITDLRPAPGTIAAGVPLFVDVSVTNFGTSASEQIPLSVESISMDNATALDDPSSLGGRSSELPAVLIDRMEPGETISRRVQVYFPSPGRHVVYAHLPADALEADNHRWCVIPLPPFIPVAVIDGDPARRNASYLSSVFQPGSRVQTGMQPVEMPLSFLQNATPEQLDEYSVIYLLDIPSLDAVSMTNLEGFLRRGGGVAFFVGPNTNPSAFRQWFDAGKFPLPLHRLDVQSTFLDGNTSLVIADHPVFRVLQGDGNPFASQVRIQQFIRPAPDWQPDARAGVTVLARLSQGQPIAVEQSFDDGRMIVFLTTLAPFWNTWAMQPSFVVVLLELQAYLSRSTDVPEARIVGTPIDVELDPSRSQRDVTFVVPGPKGERQTLSRQSRPIVNDQPGRQRATLGTEIREQLINQTDRPGFYESWVRRITGDVDVERYAFNVDTRESDLRIVEPEELAASLAVTNARLVAADELTLGHDENRGVPWSTYLLWFLLVLVLGEQVLGYFASYHPSKIKGAA